MSAPLPSPRGLGRFEVVRFPTPSLADRIVRCRRDPNSAGYEIKAVGTSVEECEWARPKEAARFAGWKLAKIEPNEREGTHDWYFLNVRANEDEYNAARSYLDDSHEHPVITRTYVVPRADYAPAEVGDPDPVDETLVLYEQEQIRSEDPVVDSLFVAVRRVYGPPTGPELSVSSSGAVGLTPGKFSGLVSTTQTRRRVPPGTAAGAGSGSSMSVVEEESVTRAMKIDTQESISNGSFPGKIAYVDRTIGDVTEAIVGDGAAPATGLLVASSDVVPAGNGKSVKRDVVVASHPQLVGSTIDHALNTVVWHTEQFVSPPSAPTGEPNVEYQIVNEDKCLKRVEQVPEDALDDYNIVVPATANIRVPDVLESVAVIWNEVSSEGDWDSEASGAASGESYSFGVSEEGTANSSGALIPSIDYRIKQIWANNIPTRLLFFYLPSPVTESDLLDKAGDILGGSIQKWPVFKPESVTFVLKGIRAGVSARVSASASVSISPNSSVDKQTSGEGGGFDLTPSTEVLRLPPTIHEAMSLNDTERSATVEAFATAEWTSWGSLPSANVSKDAEYEMNASVSPTAIPATTPDAIPVSGLYLIDSQVRPYKWGYVNCFVEILNAEVFADA